MDVSNISLSCTSQMIWYAITLVKHDSHPSQPLFHKTSTARRRALKAISMQLQEQLRKLKKENIRLAEQNQNLERRVSHSRTSVSADTLHRYKEEVRYDFRDQHMYLSWSNYLNSRSDSGDVVVVSLRYTLHKRCFSRRLCFGTCRKCFIAWRWYQEWTQKLKKYRTAA